MSLTYRKPYRKETVSWYYQKWWSFKCISFQIWLFWISILDFRGCTPPDSTNMTGWKHPTTNWVDVSPMKKKRGNFLAGHVCHGKKSRRYFPWNTGCFIGILIMILLWSPHKWVVESPEPVFFIAHVSFGEAKFYSYTHWKGTEVLPTSYSQPFWTMEYRFGNFRLSMFPIWYQWFLYVS